MSTHPYSNVAIIAVYNTRQARVLDATSPLVVETEAILGALDRAGVDRLEVDGVVSQNAATLVYALGLGPAWSSTVMPGVHGVVDGANAITAGLAETVVVSGCRVGVYVDHASTAPWTRPTNEFVVAAGLFTAAEFALVARRHMARYGTTPEQLARVATVIRNNGNVNPEAVYYGRGPFTVEDILASRMVADPFHLLDCSMTSEGGGALVMTTAERARDLVERPVYILGAGLDLMGPAYQHPPAWDLQGAASGASNGLVGSRAAKRCFDTCGLQPSDVDLIEFYDPFSFEVIRKLEAFGFCGEGEGGAFVEDGNIDPEGRFPINSDGGLLSYSHGGAQALQRVSRAVQQLQGTCATRQVAGAEVALCDNFGAGALFDDVMLLGTSRP